MSSRWGQQSVSFERREVRLFKFPESSPVTEDENDCLPVTLWIKQPQASRRWDFWAWLQPPGRKQRITTECALEGDQRQPGTRTRAEHLPSSAQTRARIRSRLPLSSRLVDPDCLSVCPPRISELQEDPLLLHLIHFSFKRFKSIHNCGGQVRARYPKRAPKS